MRATVRSGCRWNELQRIRSIPPSPVTGASRDSATCACSVRPGAPAHSQQSDSMLICDSCSGRQLRAAATFRPIVRPAVQRRGYNAVPSCFSKPGSGPCQGLALRTASLSRRDISTRAAAEDPYQVLGISPNSDSEAVSRAYKTKLRDAGKDEGRKQRVESAHSSIMMASLTSRLKGGGQAVSKDIKFADRAQYFPWRPRRYQAGRNFILIIGAIQAFLLSWSLLSPVTAGTQPLVTSAAVGAGANLFKQNQIFPPPPSGSEDPEKKGRGIKNVLRGLILAITATFIGCAVFVTLPDTLAGAFNRAMPYWFYESQNQILCVGTVVSNFIMTSFFR